MRIPELLPARNRMSAYYNVVPESLPAYRIGVLFLHPACNMHCRFCITENTTDTLSFEQAQQALSAIRARGINHIVLGGGEPFAWPHGTVELARWAKAQGYFVQVGTNGIAMPDHPDRIDAIDRYVLPLDATDPALHNELRRYGPGHHGLVLDRLETLRQSAVSVTVSTVVTARNIDGLPDLGAFLADYNQRGGRLHAWHLYKFIPQGRGGRKHARELAVSDYDYDAAVAQAKQGRNGFHIYKRKDMRHSRTVDFFWSERGVLRAGSEVW